MDFLLIVFLTLLNGVFTMSELALTASRKARLNAMAQDGDKGAQAALTLLGNPNRFLSTVQVGITSIGVLNGIVGAAAFSAGVAAWLHGFGVAEKAAAISATAVVVTLITFTTIIFGELVPKRIGQLYPEPVARWVTEEEISASLEEGVDAGLIEQHEHQMVKNVFRLDDRPLISLMVPRADVQWLEATNTVTQGLKIAGSGSQNNAHSWYPVCRGSLDDVVGKISVARLLKLGAEAPGLIESYVT